MQPLLYKLIRFNIIFRFIVSFLLWQFIWIVLL